MILGEDFQDVGMIEVAADFAGALEALDEGQVSVHLRVRDLKSDSLAGTHVGGAVHGIDIAAGNDAVDAVVIELFARINRRSYLI
jgi:hypothetical protein